MDREPEHVEGNEFVPIISRYCSGRGQHHVGAYYLDGYRELNDGRCECYEFYRCYYHRCPICFPERSKVVRCKHREDSYVTIEKAYIDTMDKERLIKSMMNFDESVDKWTVMWEHDYNENKSSIKAKLDEQSMYDLVGKLNPRESVKGGGGHTEVFHMHAIVKDPEKQSIKYLDVNSLYPYVMANIDFPVGHPII